MAFGDVLAGNLIAVGRTDFRSVRLWCRTERPGAFRLRVRGGAGSEAIDRAVVFQVPAERDQTLSLAYPDDFPGEPALAPLTRYNASITADDGTIMVGEATWETAPRTPADTPDRFSIGVVSCHQPFDSGSGQDREQNLALLKALPAALQRYNAKLLVMAGDQIYADEPRAFSPFDPGYCRRLGRDPDLRNWSAEDIRTAWHLRYRAFWAPLSWRKLMSMGPSYSILDDHEAYDDWGSLPAAEEQRLANVATGARLAYMDYQGSKHGAWTGRAGDLTPALDYDFRYGTLAGFVFDLRSERSRAQSRLISAAQLERFRAFLARSTDAQVLLLVTSVPFVHIPEWVTRLGQAAFDTSVDFPDQWSATHNLPDRGRVLAALNEHLSKPETARQKVVIVGGDVHIGCAFVLRLVGSGRPLYQLTSSALSNPLLGKVARLIPQRWLLPAGPGLYADGSRTSDNTLEIKLLTPRQGGPGVNPCSGLNAGIVECERRGDTTQVRLKLLGPGPTGAVEVFESALL